QAGKTWGKYACVQKDVGSIITARIAVDWFVMALAATGMAGVLRFRSSLNGILWTDWAVFEPVSMTFRYLEFEIELTSTNPTKTPEVTLCTITVDVPDKEINFADHTILAAGTEIQYGHTFHEIPSVSPTALGGNKAAELISKDETKCFIKIREVSTGNYVAGTADIRVRGY
ncbi:MAG TPA: hypothetical protein PKO06_11035, partial [Candidatus Ozemobacteraceae bacterium]|nr:hypothetical protein [Candidatus Ozemobacteraceae bacterium]